MNMLHIGPDVKHIEISLLRNSSRIEYLMDVLKQLGKNGNGYYMDIAIRRELKEIFNCLENDLGGFEIESIK